MALQGSGAGKEHGLGVISPLRASRSPFSFFSRHFHPIQKPCLLPEFVWLSLEQGYRAWWPWLRRVFRVCVSTCWSRPPQKARSPSFFLSVCHQKDISFDSKEEPAHKFLDVRLSTENAAFLKAVGVDVALVTTETAEGLIAESLQAFLRSQPPRGVRVLHDAQATSLLTNIGHRRVLGVRFKRSGVNSFDGLSKETEANLFGDAFVCSLSTEDLNTLHRGQVATVANYRIVAGLNGEVLDCFFLARDDSLSSLDAFLDVARGAGCPFSFSFLFLFFFFSFLSCS